MSDPRSIEGFVIQGPFGETGYEYTTFGRTPAEAWRRCFLGANDTSPGDTAIRRHRARSRGWKPIPAKMIIQGID